jgi:D-alanyl-D-alanine dipeptidase
MIPSLKPLLLSIVLLANMPDDLRLKPLPDELRLGATALDYHDVPITAQNDPMVNLRTYHIAGDQYYARRDGLNPPYYKQVCVHDKGELLARKSVATKLAAVNQLLRPYGVELYVYDSYRPVDCQRALWRYFTNAVGSDAGKYCSDPTGFDPRNSKTWPTHATGGAIDLTLRSIATHELLYMGTVFDDASEASYTNAFEPANGESNSASIVEAQRNRRLLYWAMHSQGFTNYPYEWWHFDYGTQMWVKNSSQLKTKPTRAIYGLPQR